MLLITCLPLQNSPQPLRRTLSSLRILVLRGKPDVLHHVVLVGAILENGIASRLAIFGRNVLGIGTHFDKVLQEHLHMVIDGRA